MNMVIMGDGMEWVEGEEEVPLCLLYSFNNETNHLLTEMT